MNLSDPIRASKVLVYGLQTLLGDAVLVGYAIAILVDGTKRFVLQAWRCYIVYNKSLYVMIPTGAVLLANLSKWSLSTFYRY
jgi:hypothetical protein